MNMKQREYCSGSMAKLEESIARVSLQTHDASNLNGIWDEIRLNVDSLSFDHFTAVALDEHPDPELQADIAALFRKAADTIPSDVDSRVTAGIQRKIEQVLNPESDGESDD